jgi:hypothetical protein
MKSSINADKISRISRVRNKKKGKRAGEALREKRFGAGTRMPVPGFRDHYAVTKLRKKQFKN